MDVRRKARPRYRFAQFTVSPARRQLLREGREVPLVPRYFDLLLLLLERRQEAVHRREILDSVWTDVVVSDGALSQAVRTLRRALGDDPRNPAFIRTVSRHGYQFVHPHVDEEEESLSPIPGSSAPETLAPPSESSAAEDAFEPLLERLLAPAGVEDEDRREAAEALHALGTEETLRRLDARPGCGTARAWLRESRWNVPGAGRVPLLGQPGAVGSIAFLLGLRLRQAALLAARRWGAGSLGGAGAGALAGFIGGVVLRTASGSDALFRLPVVFSLVGAAIGGIGAAGVGAGLAVAEAVARSLRGTALLVCGAVGGGTVGSLAHLLAAWLVEAVFGRELPPAGGGLEGMVMGGAAGLGYALSTPRPWGGGMAAPRGGARLAAAAITGACCAAAAVGLTWTGSPLGGVSLDLMARSFQGSHVGLAPLGRLFGEQGLGPVTRTLLGIYEGFFFGFGLVLGLTRRPASRRDLTASRR